MSERIRDIVWGFSMFFGGLQLGLYVGDIQPWSMIAAFIGFALVACAICWPSKRKVQP